jgi:hypothetical protein
MNESNFCKPIIVEQIIKDYLRENGFDGLFHDNDCGCLIDGLCPCGGDPLLCEPGYRKPIPREHPQYGEVDWIIGPSDNPPPKGEKVSNQRYVRDNEVSNKGLVMNQAREDDPR